MRDHGTEASTESWEAQIDPKLPAWADSLRQEDQRCLADIHKYLLYGQLGRPPRDGPGILNNHNC